MLGPDAERRADAVQVFGPNQFCLCGDTTCNTRPLILTISQLDKSDREQ
ncbi:hypothetical protein RvY_00134 [Ramazzottius varieornatus]|uniref:Uncharacterized protein n=1 Tax=Ramazzottius varieornatus TaxID=947166 RepID=A0A1D1ULN2_RAMVA|nr:hypothetical protein RvY_00134 [Ramazzottius varieornatus]